MVSKSNAAQARGLAAKLESQTKAEASLAAKFDRVLYPVSVLAHFFFFTWLARTNAQPPGPSTCNINRNQNIRHHGVNHVNSTPHIKCIVPIVREQERMVDSGVNTVNIELIS